MPDLTLGAEFPAATRDEWLRLVEGVLKGAAFDEKLVAHTPDGLRIEPLYPKAEASSRPLRTAQGRWRIAQRVDHPEPKAANELALADLEGGADALTLVFADAASARGFGLTARTVDDLDKALNKVRLELIHLRLDAGLAGFAAADLVANLAERRGHALADLDLDVGLDPIGAMAAGGGAAWADIAPRCAETFSRLSGRGFRGRAFMADGRPYHEAGAGEAQELAAVLATGVAYFRALEAGGIGLDAAGDALSFLLAADADQFLTMAKFRALRRLWARVEEACGLPAKPIHIHAETSWRMTTRRDPWVNLLRATVAVCAAGLGGADTITALPFTAALGLPDAFARRMARNTHLILLDEAHLWRVADPAAGAGGIEALTDALCERAWSLFQDIEREGGMAGSLGAGALQARIAEMRSACARAAATRDAPITGTSEFPNLKELPVNVLLPSPPRSGMGAGSRDSSAPSLLPSIRAAEPFERLRAASDAMLARTGARPKVFLANLGPPAAFTARAAAAQNFFAAGGIEAVTNDGFSSAEVAAAAFAASGARLACLCSSDHIYASQAAPVAAALRGAGARAIYVAGPPDRLEKEPVQAGVTSHVFAGCDALALLSDALEKAAT